MDYKQKWNEGMSYAEYRKRIADLLEEGKTTGPKQTETLVQYSDLNQHRMNRLDKTFDPAEFELASLKKHSGLKVLVLTEGWCGDAAQVIPVLEKVMSSAGVEVKYLLRDENLDLIDKHLTNGGRSIPVVLFLGADFQLLEKWGPRPKPLQEMVESYLKAPEPKESYAEFSKQTQLWYAKDKQQTMVEEWLKIAERI